MTVAITQNTTTASLICINLSFLAPSTSPLVNLSLTRTSEHCLNYRCLLLFIPPDPLCVCNAAPDYCLKGLH